MVPEQKGDIVIRVEPSFVYTHTKKRISGTRVGRKRTEPVH